MYLIRLISSVTGEEIKRNKPSFMLIFSLHRKRWKLESIQSLATSSTDLSRGGMVTSPSKLSNGGYASPSTPCATASSFTYLHYDTFPMVFNISCLLYFCIYSSSRSNRRRGGVFPWFCCTNRSRKMWPPKLVVLMSNIPNSCYPVPGSATENLLSFDRLETYIVMSE